jgi:hypothetical protein
VRTTTAPARARARPGPTRARSARPEVRQRAMAGGLAVLAVLVATVSAIGVLARGDGTTEAVVSVRGEAYDLVTTGIYANNAERLVAEGIGWDLVTLLLVVPAMLATAWFVARGSLRARLCALGLLGYVLYQYLMYATTWAIGPLLPAFVVLFAAAIVGIAWVASSIDLEHLAGRVTDRFPHRGIVVLSTLIGLLLIGMWAPRLAAVIGGDLDGVLLGQTTLVVQVLDLGLIVPLAAATAVLVHRRRPVGYLLAAAIVVKGLSMATAIVAMVLVGWRIEGTLEVGGLVTFTTIALACLVLTVYVLRSITGPEAAVATVDP